MCSAKILIVEDEVLIAEEIKYSLTSLGYSVVGHAMNGDKALDLFARQDADLVLLDINIKGSRNGIDLGGVLREKYDIPFVYLTSFSDENTLNQAMATMPYGYIVKPFNENDLKVNIQLAMNKHQREQQKQENSKEYLENKFGKEITSREYSVLKCFMAGNTYKEVAAHLDISINTVKSYQKRLYELFEVESKAELVRKLAL